MLGLTQAEKLSVGVTAGLALVFIAAAVLSFERSGLFLAVSLGCVGGLMHELAQSGGKILFFARKEDGLYLGGLAGMMLGGITGVIAAHALPATASIDYNSLAYESFMAGMGLKGLAEAAAGSSLNTSAGGAQPSSTTNVQTLQGLPAAPSRVMAPSF